MTETEKIAKILTMHEIQVVVDDNRGIRQWFECSCSTGTEEAWRGNTKADHVKHQSEMLAQLFLGVRAAELIDVVDNTTYGWAIGTTLKRRADFILRGIDPKLQCVRCGGGGQSWSNEEKCMIQCPPCLGEGFSEEGARWRNEHDDAPAKTL